MAETLLIQADRNNKQAVYSELIHTLRAILQNEQDEIATMAIVSSVLSAAFGWHWVGFYRVVGDRLLIGPYQGPLACMQISFGKGVCGTAWKQNVTLIVPDVDAFPGHIACSSFSKSEIVIPLRDAFGNVRAVLDVDSDKPDDFSLEDQAGLEEIVSMIAGCIYR